jgi:regulator of replication initiation timing
VTIPTWALPLLVTIFVLVLGFAWRLATRAETLTDNLKACIDRLTAMEVRLAAITALERAASLAERDTEHLREALERLEKNAVADKARAEQGVTELRQRYHELAQIAQTLVARCEALSKENAHLHQRLDSMNHAPLAPSPRKP